MQQGRGGGGGGGGDSFYKYKSRNAVIACLSSKEIHVHNVASPDKSFIIEVGIPLTSHTKCFFSIAKPQTIWATN